MSKQGFILIISLVVFSLSLILGFRYSYNKACWGDEIYTQIDSVERNSYLSIAKRDLREGNISPLFYITQKFTIDLFGYKTPRIWVNGRFSYEHKYSQIILRINSVIFLSISLALICYFFSSRYSPFLGIYSFLIGISSYMYWGYIAEARPYALWFFLTTVQMMIVLHLIKEGKVAKGYWRSLCLVNILLSFTIVFSAVQIIVVALVLYFFVLKDIWKYISVFIVPFAICLFYYFLSGKSGYCFVEGPLQLISAAIPKDRILIVFVSGVLFFVNEKLRKQKTVWNILDDGECNLQKAFSLLFYIILIFSFGILAVFKMTESNIDGCYQVPNRYFIYLAPVGIIATTFASIYLVKASRSKMIKAITGMILLAFLLFRFYKTFSIVSVPVF